MSDTRSIPAFDKILNLRDVGSYINDQTHDHRLKQGLLYRSARPDAATPQDCHRLQFDLRLKTIIDLRTPTEHVQQARKQLSADIPSAPGSAPSDPQKPLRIQGITYRDVNFNGSAYSTALIRQLTYRQVAKLAGLYAFGYRTEAISVLGTNVMAKRGLAGLAEDSLTHCKREVKAVFDILADDTVYPLMLHCTQGKDRTGLVILLLLLILNVPVEVIQQDYVLSEKELESEREEKLVEIRSIGLPDSFADCPSDWVPHVCTFLDREYGGVQGYLVACQVSREQQQKLSQILVHHPVFAQTRS